MNVLIMFQWKLIIIRFLVFFIILSVQVFGQSENPCEDIRYIKLKEKSLDEMSDREYQYFKRKDEDCSNFNINPNPKNKFDQGLNPFNNDEQKMMIYYQSEKISSLSAIALEWFLPTLGYAYADRWGKGIFFAGLRLGTLIYAIDNYRSTTKGKFRGWVGYSASSTDNCTVNYSEECEIYDDDIASNKNETILLMALWAGLTIYQSFDLHKTVQQHNHNLYKDIFGKDPPSFTLNLQPTYQGANLNLTYYFN